MKIHKQALVLIFLFLCSYDLIAQESYYVVETDSLNFRSKPEINSIAYAKLKRGEIVEYLNSYDDKWSKVKYLGIEGYLYSKYIKPLDQSSEYSAWTQLFTTTGERLECSNINPQRDLTIDNYFEIENTTDGDAVVKMINQNNECIRMAFVSQGQSYKITNIPQGIYTTKVAFGKRLSKTYEAGGVCYIKFLVNPEYKDYNGPEDKFNFYLKTREEERADGRYTVTSVPNHGITLYIERTPNRFFKLETDNTSESEFNK